MKFSVLVYWFVLVAEFLEPYLKASFVTQFLILLCLWILSSHMQFTFCVQLQKVHRLLKSHSLINLSRQLQLYLKIFCFRHLTFFLSLYWICNNITSILCFVFLVSSHVDISSPTRDQTCTPCIRRQSLNHWTARICFLMSSSLWYFQSCFSNNSAT